MIIYNSTDTQYICIFVLDKRTCEAVQLLWGSYFVDTRHGGDMLDAFPRKACSTSMIVRERESTDHCLHWFDP